MDWTQLLLAAAGGVVGGAAGAALGWFGPQLVGMRSRLLAVILAALLAVAGGRMLPELLRPAQSESQTLAAELDRLRAGPVLAAVAEREPRRVEIWRTRLAQAGRASGRDGVRNERRDLAAEETARALREYSPRAQDEDLVAVYRATRDLGAALRSSPHACHAMFFGDRAGLSAAEAGRGDSAAAQDALDAALAQMVRGAARDAVPYDAAAAAPVQQAAGRALAGLTPGQQRMLSGTAPRDTADAAAVCDAMLAFLGVYLDSENPANALRGLLAAEG